MCKVFLLLLISYSVQRFMHIFKDLSQMAVAYLFSGIYIYIYIYIPSGNSFLKVYLCAFIKIMNVLVYMEFIESPITFLSIEKYAANT